MAGYANERDRIIQSGIIRCSKNKEKKVEYKGEMYTRYEEIEITKYRYTVQFVNGDNLEKSETERIYENEEK